MRVKICGITNLEDALISIDAGASALGFVFYKKSPRYISPEKALKIVEKLPPFVERVGLFVNSTCSEIDYMCTKSKMSLAQIHFDADSSLYQNLKTPHIKVIRASCKDDIKKFDDEYRIVDAFVQNYGGKGKRVDMSWFESGECSKIILAGGLTCDNVEEIKQFGFYGVDVSSGVEQTKEKKDSIKIVDFIKKATS